MHVYLALVMYDLMVNHFVERVHLVNLAGPAPTTPYHTIAYQVAHVGQDNEIVACPGLVSRSVACWLPVDLDSIHSLYESR